MSRAVFKKKKGPRILKILIQLGIVWDCRNLAVRIDKNKMFQLDLTAKKVHTKRS